MAGHLLLLNFGTLPETNRFKTLAIERKFLAADLMDVHPPGELLQEGGVRKVRRAGVGEVCSFHGLKEDVWASKLADGTPFQEAFRKWMERVVRPGVHCAYLNGHHWRAGSPACRGRSPRPSGRSGRTENHWMECAAARGLQARFPYRGRKAGYVLSRSMKR